MKTPKYDYLPFIAEVKLVGQETQRKKEGWSWIWPHKDNILGKWQDIHVTDTKKKT